VKILRISILNEQGNWLSFSLPSLEETEAFVRFLRSNYYSGFKAREMQLVRSELRTMLFLYPKEFSRRAVTYSALKTGLIFDPPISRFMSYVKDFETARTKEEKEKCLKRVLDEFAGYLERREKIAAYCFNVTIEDENASATLYTQVSKNVVVKNVLEFERGTAASFLANAITSTVRELLNTKYFKKSVLERKTKWHVENFLQVAPPKAIPKKVVVK